MTCRPHGGQTQGSLLRALSDGVKCPGERQPFVLPTRLEVAWRGCSDYIINDVPTLNGGGPICKVCMRVLALFGAPRFTQLSLCALYFSSPLSHGTTSVIVADA